MQIQIIGHIESCYKDKFGTPRQGVLVPSSIGKITFDTKIQPDLALQGLETFSHIWLMFIFDQNENTKYRPKIHPPRMGGDSIGVFASRSPHRPNPIGLTLCKLEEVGSNYIVVSGVDLVDKTPIIDIKPYLPQIDFAPNAQSGWLDNLSSNEYQINWSPEMLAVVQVWAERIKKSDLKECIEQTLKLDPRPVVYRQNDYKPHHFLRLFDGDIQFEFLPENIINIIGIRF